MERRTNSIASARASQTVKLVKKEKDDEAECQEIGPSFADLPSAIIAHFLLQLPVKCVLICRCVCRTWNALISEPQFAKLHFERAPICLMIRNRDPRVQSRFAHLLEYEPKKFESDCNNHVKLETKLMLPPRDAKLRDAKLLPDEIQKMRQMDHIACKPDKFCVLNSCNGLLCLCDPSSRDPLVVCNPVIGEFTRLPEATKNEEYKLTETIYAGFGVQPKTNEYKVLRICVINPISYLKKVLPFVYVEMHTLGTPTWRNIGVDPGFLISRLEFPTSVNGALHWISFDCRQRSILCFDFKSERFRSFPCPPFALENDEIQDRLSVSMAESEGFLYICDALLGDSCTMWVMKEYGIEESWTKVFNIDNLGVSRWPYGLCWPIKHVKNSAAILVQHSCNCFGFYEPEKYGFKIFQVGRTESEFFEVIPYTPSLISVKGDNIMVLNVYSQYEKFKLPAEYEVHFMARDR